MRCGGSCSKTLRGRPVAEGGHPMQSHQCCCEPDLTATYISGNSSSNSNSSLRGLSTIVPPLLLERRDLAAAAVVVRLPRVRGVQGVAMSRSSNSSRLRMAGMTLLRPSGPMLAVERSKSPRSRRS